MITESGGEEEEEEEDLFVFNDTISNDGNPWLTGAGAVSKDKKAPSAQLGDAMGFGKE
jgi:hypothetical protein